MVVREDQRLTGFVGKRCDFRFRGLLVDFRFSLPRDRARSRERDFFSSSSCCVVGELGLYRALYRSIIGLVQFLFTIRRRITRQLRDRLLITLAGRRKSVVITATGQGRARKSIARNVRHFNFRACVLPFRIARSASSARVLISNGNSMLLRIVRSFIRVLNIVSECKGSCLEYASRVSKDLMTLRSFRCLTRRAIYRWRTTQFGLGNDGVALNDGDLSLTLFNVVKGRYAQNVQVRHIRRTGQCINVLDQLSADQV